jgi:deoxyadenosine/deoxycytidine kinase
MHYTHPREWAFPFSLAVLLAYVDIHHTIKETACVTERSPLSNRMFAHMSWTDGTLTQEEWDTYKQCHETLGWNPDAIVYVDTPPEVCSERIVRRGRRSELAGGGIDLTYLRRIAQQYELLFKYYQGDVRRVDGTQAPEKVAADIEDAVRDLMESNVS